MNELTIKPVQSENTDPGFVEQILAELLAEGLSGDDLMAAFKQRQAQIRPAVQNMLREAEAIAAGTSEYSTFEDIFGQED